MSHEAPIAPAPAPEAASLKRRAVRGTVLSLVSVFGMQVLRLAGNLITTRILFPEAYGLMALVLVLNQGLQMISDVGIIPSIVQHPRGEERSFLDTAWTIQVLRGAVITVLAAALALPYARFYGHDELLPLILVASIQGFVTGLDSTKYGTLNRRIELGRLVFINIAGQLVMTGVMVVWALLSPTVWSLLGGALAGDILRLILTHVALPGPHNRFRWERDAARVIFDFGKWIFLSTLVTYIGIRFDVMALGKLEQDAPDGLDVLGVYNIGQNLAALPVLITGQVVSWVLLPALSESFRGDGAGFFARVQRARRSLNAMGVLMIAGTAIAAPSFFYLLYDPRYHAAGWMVQLTMLPAWFFFLQETSIRVQLAMGDARAQMLANVARLAGTIPGALVGYELGARYLGDGLPGLILGLTLGSLIGYAAVAWGLAQKGLRIVRSDMRWTLVALSLGALGGVTPWLVGPRAGVDAELVSVVIGAAVIGPYAVWVARVVVADLRQRG
jgi:O-antigen/teichoic acid export membrane protein